MPEDLTYIRDPWAIWNSRNTTLTLTAATTTNYTTWQQWHMTASATLWNTWNQNLTITTRLGVNPGPAWTPMPPETPEERAERDRRRRERETTRQVAVARARCMLDSVLQPEQKAELESAGHFHVRGSRGRRYRICARGQSGNVELLQENGAVQARLCAHPSGGLPDPDAWLAQLLALEHDEDHFLRTANVHAGRLPAGVR